MRASTAQAQQPRSRRSTPIRPSTSHQPSDHQPFNLLPTRHPPLPLTNPSHLPPSTCQVITEAARRDSTEPIEREPTSPRRPQPEGHLSSALDDEVVFLYKAMRGTCTDSFGSHCAAAADVPPTIIQRARHISRCRLEGLPIERIDIDSARAEARDRGRAISHIQEPRVLNPNAPKPTPSPNPDPDRGERGGAHDAGRHVPRL